jgi:hypothetical protein
LNIRFATLKDAQILIQWQIAMALESEGMKLDPATISKGVHALFSDPKKGRYLLASDDAQVPLGCLLLIDEWSDWRNRTVLWIHSVYVTPLARKQGVYKSMYRYLQQMVEADASLGGLRLYVDKRNISAQIVYESLGMNGEHYQLYEWLKPL